MPSSYLIMTCALWGFVEDISPKSWQIHVFEANLFNLGIDLINSRSQHPQTNGKLEGLHLTIEEQIIHWSDLSDRI